MPDRRLHLAAAEADESGYPSAAASISEIAEAAGEAWMRAEAAYGHMAVVQN